MTDSNIVERSRAFDEDEVDEFIDADSMTIGHYRNATGGLNASIIMLVDDVDEDDDPYRIAITFSLDIEGAHRLIEKINRYIDNAKRTAN